MVNDVDITADVASAVPSLDAVWKTARKVIGKDHSQKQTEQAAKDFEAVLLGKLLDEMKKTIPESGLLENPLSKQMKDLFWFYLSQELADKGGIGLWREIYRQMNATHPQVPPGATLEQLT